MHEQFIPVPIVTYENGLELIRGILHSPAFWENAHSFLVRYHEERGFIKADGLIKSFNEVLEQYFIHNLYESNSTIEMLNPAYVQEG